MNENNDIISGILEAVRNVDNTLFSMHSAIGGLTREIRSLKSEIETLKATVTTHSELITTLQQAGLSSQTSTPQGLFSGLQLTGYCDRVKNGKFDWSEIEDLCFQVALDKDVSMINFDFELLKNKSMGPSGYYYCKDYEK